nr:6K2 [Hyacinth mosaic virus]
GVNEVACELALKGRWNKSLVTQDLFLLVPLFVGGVWMTYTYFKNMYEKKVYHQ